jgi:pyrrolidone-carboxylate peptidase
MTTVLLTGSEAFAGPASNSSSDAVERVAQNWTAQTWSGDSELAIELLHVKAIAARICEAGIPSQVSDTAGTYVCNSLSTRRCVRSKARMRWPVSSTYPAQLCGADANNGDSRSTILRAS